MLSKETEANIREFHCRHRRTMQDIQERLMNLQQNRADRKRSRTLDDEAITSADSESEKHSPRAHQSPSPK